MPPKKSDDILLLDMLFYCDDAVRFASTLTFAEFEVSRLHQMVIVKAVETIGEAASQISGATQQAHPEIPWPEIIGMRNRLVHGYGTIELDVVWQTVTEDIPSLADQLRRMIPKDAG